VNRERYEVPVDLNFLESYDSYLNVVLNNSENNISNFEVFNQDGTSL